MATRKAPVPTIHYGWMPVKARAGRGAPMRIIDHKVAVSIRAANGEKLAPITQGAKDKRDAKRSVLALVTALSGESGALLLEGRIADGMVAEIGPGPKPKLVPADKDGL